MQLAAQRIALNLREAGFNMQMAPAGSQHADLTLRRLLISGNDPAAALERILWDAGKLAAVSEQSTADLYRREQSILEDHRIIPLLDLPIGYASGARVRDLRLRADGSADLAGASLEDAR
jgi:hypothetical protein